MTIVLCVINAIAGFIIRANESFFVSSTVSLYAVFLLFAGLQSIDNASCNIWHDDSQGSLWIGYIISFLSIGYAALRADRIGLLTYQQHKDQNVDDNNDTEDNEIGGSVNTKLKDGSDDEDNYDSDDENNNNGDDDKSKEKEKDKALKKQHTFFHIILTLAACYYAMLFTNWANSNKIDTKGDTALWVNMGSQWCCIFLFWWTLAAPIICPNRDFSGQGVPNDDDEDVI